MRIFRLSQRVAKNSVLLGYGAGSLGNRILKFRGSAVPAISKDTSTSGEKGITSYRNVGISLPLYATSHPRRFLVFCIGDVYFSETRVWVLAFGDFWLLFIQQLAVF